LGVTTKGRNRCLDYVLLYEGDKEYNDNDKDKEEYDKLNDYEGQVM
jgi:hypothetical protein